MLSSWLTRFVLSLSHTKLRILPQKRLILTSICTRLYTGLKQINKLNRLKSQKQRNLKTSFRLRSSIPLIKITNRLKIFVRLVILEMILAISNSKAPLVKNYLLQLIRMYSMNLNLVKSEEKFKKSSLFHIQTISRVCEIYLVQKIKYTLYFRSLEMYLT